MNMTELTKVIDQVGKDKGIKKEIIIEALEQAILASAKKKFGVGAQLETHFNPDSGEIELFQFKTVVENEDEVGDPDMDIILEEARGFDPDVNIGDDLGIKLDTPTFGRIDAQTAKQIIFQKVRDAERDIIYNEYVHRQGEIISGIARRAERGNIVIDLGRGDALLPKNEIIPGEHYKPGDRVQAYLKSVNITSKGPEIILSRSCNEYLMKLFAQEVPEMRDGVIEIKYAAREPGNRAKIAVISKDREIDPVGACVGMKGVRVQAVISELKGERIDIIQWNENPALFVKAALAPAEISSMKMDERNRMMEIMVEDNQLSLAIGKRGQNVRLAAKLTGWKIDIISKTKQQKRVSDAIFNLKHIDGINETIAQGIFQAGFHNVYQIAESSSDQLVKIPGFNTEAEAEGLLERAKKAIEIHGDKLKLGTDGNTLESLGTGVVAAGAKMTTEGGMAIAASNDAKSQAEQRLREALAEAQRAK